MAMQFLVQTKMLLRMKGGVIKCTEARGARPTRPEWTVRKTSLSTAEMRLQNMGWPPPVKVMATRSLYSGKSEPQAHIYPMTSCPSPKE